MLESRTYTHRRCQTQTEVSIVLAIAGAIGGVVVREAIFAKRILRRVCGVDDPRALR